MSYAVVGAIPLVLWGVHAPIAGMTLLAILAGLGLGGRTVARLVRCLNHCGGFAFDLGGRIHVTVTRSGTTDVC